MQQAPPSRESAIHRAVNPGWSETLDTGLLRLIEHSLRVLRWQKTVDAQSGAGYPEPIPLPWDPPPKGTIAGDAMTLEETVKFLGWDLPDPVAPAAHH